MHSAARPKHWVFCSSGARTLYLENVVRVLALPAGEIVKFRYEADIVSSTFKGLVGAKPIQSSPPVYGDTAYIAYLDNRDKLKPPQVYPVREAKIRSVSVLGTTYVVQLDLLRFIDWNADDQLNQTILTHVSDSLPHWVPQGETDPTQIKHEGNWVAATQPLSESLFRPYNASTRSHLQAFESGVRAVSRGTDFSDGKRLFVSFLGLYDARYNRLVENATLHAGRTYDLYLYQYLAGDDTHNPLARFRLKASTDNKDVTVVGASERQIEARYDEIVLPFRVAEDAKNGSTNIGVDVLRFDDGVDDPVYILRGAIHQKIQSSWLRKILFGSLIGLGLFGTQAVTLFSTQKLTALYFVTALAFSMLAGMGAAFQFKTKV